MKIAKPIRDLIEAFEKLPGIGPKTAQRLTFYLLHTPESHLEQFASALTRLKKDTKVCSTCRNVSESDPCFYCTDTGRKKDTVLIVEQPLDILVFEKTGKYKGLYHVLHGSINPLENIGPDELFIDDLIKRVKKTEAITEIIVATNPTMEGEATAMYITKKLKEEVPANGRVVKITRLGVGIPTGAHLEFADETTINQAMEGRRSL